jgi:sulfate transport system substrate-binding protein
MTQAKKKRQPGRLIARLGIAAVALGATVGVAACGSSGSSLSLVAYSTPQQVYEQSLEPAFKKTSDGKDVDFSNSFGASGDQSRAVESGQPADVVEFSLQPDMQRLVDAGIVADDWDQNQYKGIVTDSVVTLMVRPGNPKNITTFDDLATRTSQRDRPNRPPPAGPTLEHHVHLRVADQRGKSRAGAGPVRVLANTSVQDSSARDRWTRSPAARATCWWATRTMPFRPEGRHRRLRHARQRS